MPRLNDVFLVGVVLDRASVKVNKEGETVQAALPIQVIHGRRQFGSPFELKINNEGYDDLWILSSDPEQIEEILTCEPFDAIEVKGCLRVAVVNKKMICPECGEKVIRKGTKTTVFPIYLANRGKTYTAKEITKDNISTVRNDSVEYLRKRVEISNLAKLIGVVCKEPQLFKHDKTRRLMLSFPLAVKRKFYLANDNFRLDADFPYIKVYDSAAMEAYDLICDKSVLMIDGYISTRSIYRNIECDHCGSKFTIDDTISEVVPYAIEVLRNNVSDVTTKEKGAESAYPNAKILGSEADLDLEKPLLSLENEKEVASLLDNMDDNDSPLDTSGAPSSNPAS